MLLLPSSLMCLLATQFLTGGWSKLSVPQELLARDLLSSWQGGSLHRESKNMAAPSEWARESARSEKTSKMEVTVFCHFIKEMTSHRLC